MTAELLSYLDLHADLLWVLSLGSAAMLVGSVLVVPWLVAQAPADVFVRDVPAERGALAWSGVILRNLVGFGLLLAGLLMLVLPGQGMLTILVGLCLADVPHKRQVIRRIVTRPAVWKALTWIRERAGKPRFEKP